VYNSEASNSNINLNKTSSTVEEEEEEDDDDEDDKIKSSPQKGRTYDLQSYGGSSSVAGSNFFSSSASMINLLGAVGEKGASLDYDRKSYNILP
jgi:hypothetical protein